MQETWTPTEEELSTLDSHVSWHRLLVEHGQVLVDQAVVSHLFVYIPTCGTGQEGRSFRAPYLVIPYFFVIPSERHLLKGRSTLQDPSRTKA